MRFSRFWRFPTVAVFALVLPLGLLAGCGQKGALYLSDTPPAGVKIPKPPTPKAVPYPFGPAAEPQKQD